MDSLSLYTASQVCPYRKINPSKCNGSKRSSLHSFFPDFNRFHQRPMSEGHIGRSKVFHHAFISPKGENYCCQSKDLKAKTFVLFIAHSLKRRYLIYNSSKRDTCVSRHHLNSLLLSYILPSAEYLWVDAKSMRVRINTKKGKVGRLITITIPPLILFSQRI